MVHLQAAFPVDAGGEKAAQTAVAQKHERVVAIRGGDAQHAGAVGAGHEHAIEIIEPGRRLGFLREILKGAGDERGVFEVSSLTAGEPYLLNAECVEDSEVIEVESQALCRIVDENPATGYAF